MTSTIDSSINTNLNNDILIQMTQRFVEAFTTRSNLDTNASQATNVNTNNPPSKNTTAIKGMLDSAKQYGDSVDITGKVNQLGRNALNKMKEIESQVSMLPYIDQFKELLNSASVNLSKSKKLNIKTFNNTIAGSIKTFYEKYIKTSNEVKSTLNYNANNQYTSGKVALSEEDTPKNSYWTECVNPFYESDWSDSRVGYYTGRVLGSKPMKATLLTLVTFAVTMVLTNVVRIYLGGTPGGQFTTTWGLGLFQFFSCLFIAPIVEEPAKMISVKGGYGKHFFFAFNLLEFGGYILMFLQLGTASIGFIIILRALSVIFHAITMKIHASAKNQGPVNTGIKLGICILLHFMFNAVALKYSVLGIGGIPLLMFAIGFMGVAYGVFKVVRKGINSMTSRFQTRG